MARPIAGDVKGGPGGGTHSFTSGPDNWESDNAVDIYAPVGTPVYATTFGRIGPKSQYGPLNSSDPRMAGLRLHLYSDIGSQEFYYAHLSKIVVQPGSKVKAGQLIGYSGEANGAEHLHFAVRRGTPYDYMSGAAPRRGPVENQDGGPSHAGQQPTDPSVASAGSDRPTAEGAALMPPPGFAPPMPGGGLPTAAPMMPGSQVYSLDRRAVYSNWQRLAQTAPASRPLQQFAQLSGLGLEDE